MGRIPKVTIAMPVYNGENLVGRAIDSLLAQSFSDFELIISDNCSTDGTSLKCLAYQQQDSRITYFRQSSNIGAFWNFKYLLSQAKGEYFFYACHDDWWDVNFIREGVECLNANPNAACAFGHVEYIDENGTLVWTYEPPHGLDHDRRLNRVISYLLMKKIPDQLAYSFIRKRCLDDYEWEFSYLPEKKLIMHLLLRGKIIDAYGMRYRSHYEPKTVEYVANAFLFEMKKLDALWTKVMSTVLIGELFKHLTLAEFCVVAPIYLYKENWHKHYAKRIIRTTRIGRTLLSVRDRQKLMHRQKVWREKAETTYRMTEPPPG